MNSTILNALAWIFLLIGLILFAWKVFGDSPSDLVVLMPILLTILLKIWSVDKDVAKLKVSFRHLGEDFKEHKKHK